MLQLCATEARNLAVSFGFWFKYQPHTSAQPLQVKYEGRELLKKNSPKSSQKLHFDKNFYS